mmetsp:Transcript_3459/g.9457  ORF Transcript_3459/g.9457 Transcript_3459/m.9457 type:complete len:167 (-) Transcript_3459:209-709(-)
MAGLAFGFGFGAVTVTARGGSARRQRREEEGKEERKACARCAGRLRMGGGSRRAGPPPSGAGSSGNMFQSSRFWADGEELLYRMPACSVDWNEEWSEFAASGMRSHAGPGIAPSPKLLRDLRRTLQQQSLEELSNDWRVWAGVIALCGLLSAYAAMNAPFNGSGFV